MLVTGGGGSIGSELCRQLLKFGPKQLLILGHGENSIFEIQSELEGLLGMGNVGMRNGTGSEPIPHPAVPLAQRIPHSNGNSNGAGTELISHSLHSLFGIPHSEGVTAATTEIKTLIADIRFSSRIRMLFEEFRPEVVFHSAAHKHVPLMELNPVEAITNNVLGTRNLLDASLAVGVEHFVMIYVLA